MSQFLFLEEGRQLNINLDFYVLTCSVLEDGGSQCVIESLLNQLSAGYLHTKYNMVLKVRNQGDASFAVTTTQAGEAQNSI